MNRAFRQLQEARYWVRIVLVLGSACWCAWALRGRPLAVAEFLATTVGGSGPAAMGYSAAEYLGLLLLPFVPIAAAAGVILSSRQVASWMIPAWAANVPDGGVPHAGRVRRARLIVLGCTRGAGLLGALPIVSELVERGVSAVAGSNQTYDLFVALIGIALLSSAFALMWWLTGLVAFKVLTAESERCPRCGHRWISGQAVCPECGLSEGVLAAPR